MQGPLVFPGLSGARSWAVRTWLNNLIFPEALRTRLQAQALGSAGTLFPWLWTEPSRKAYGSVLWNALSPTPTPARLGVAALTPQKDDVWREGLNKGSD